MSTAIAERKTLVDQYVTALDSSERIRVKYAGALTNMSAEEVAQWEKWMNEADESKKKIDLLDRETNYRAWANEPTNTLKFADGNQAPAGGQKAGDQEREAAGLKAWQAYFRGVPMTSMMPETVKALAAQEGDLGGFLVLPQQLVQRLLVTVKDLLWIRQLATVFPLDKAESLGVPVLDNDFGDPTWTAELGTGVEDTTAPFGKRQLIPHPIARRIKISNKLLRQAVIDPEAIVLDRLAYRLARVSENAFLNGDGQDKPLGVFTPSVNGISTNRDTVTAGVGVVSGDDWITLKHALKPQYWAKAKIIVHRLVLSDTRKKKDTQGNYIWQAGVGGYVAQGTALVGPNPDTIVGLPYLVDELAPSTVATGQYVAVAGDFSFYWVADALNMQIQRLNELYAETNQTGFILRAELDGMPTLEEAFVRLKVQ